MQISAQNINKNYESIIKESFFTRKVVTTTALIDINFNIDTGERVAFIGPNGSGKTSIIKIMSGLILPTNGNISICKKNPFTNRKEVQKMISTFLGGGSSSFWQQLPAIETITFSRYLYEIEKNEFETRLHQLDQVLNFKEYYRRPLRQLSLGQKTKIELASKLIHRPKILFLDEPTLGLDVLTKFEVRNFLHNLSINEGTTIILTSHDPVDIDEVSDRAIVINKGKIIHDVSTEELKNKFNIKRLCLTTKKELNKELYIHLEALKISKNFSEFKISNKQNLINAIEVISQDPNILDYEIKNLELESIIRELHNA